MADPVVIDCSSACTVTVVHELSLPPLQLTLEEGAQIALAIGAVWVVGWAVRMVIKTLSTGDGNSTSEGN